MILYQIRVSYDRAGITRFITKHRSSRREAISEVVKLVRGSQLLPDLIVGVDVRKITLKDLPPKKLILGILLALEVPRLWKAVIEKEELVWERKGSRE